MIYFYMSYEQTESMLDRLLMAILRKDEILRTKTIELETKFKIIEKICYHRCQFFISGGRKGIQESKNVFLTESIESLKFLEKQWEEKVKDFEKKVIFVYKNICLDRICIK